MSSTSIYPFTKTTQFRLKLYPKNFYLVKEFYEFTLGYPIIESWDTETSKGVMFDTGSAVLELLSPDDEYLSIQGANVSLQVEDVWTLWEKLKDHPNIAKPLETRSWGDTSFRITDPEGFRISFFTSKSL